MVGVGVVVREARLVQAVLMAVMLMVVGAHP